MSEAVLLVSRLRTCAERRRWPEGILHEAASRIAELEAAQRWIPVTERLPEDGEQVTMGHYYDDMWIWIASGEIENGEFWCDFTDDSFKAICHHSVSHWKPLSEPPEIEIPQISREPTPTKSETRAIKGL